MPHDVDDLTAGQAAAEIWSGRLTSVALVTDAVARARRHVDLNAFITLGETGALQAAAAFDAALARERVCLPLGGVPVVVKDNIEVAGLPNTAGTPALRDFIPRRDAPAMDKLRRAGVLISTEI